MSESLRYFVDDGMIHDVLGPVSVVEGGQRFLEVVASGTKSSHHDCFAVTPKIILQAVLKELKIFNHFIHLEEPGKN